MGKKDKEQGLETFLKSEFLGELKNETPAGHPLQGDRGTYQAG